MTNQPLPPTIAIRPDAIAQVLQRQVDFDRNEKLLFAHDVVSLHEALASKDAELTAANETIAKLKAELAAAAPAANPEA